MLELLLEKRRKKLKRYKRLQRGRKLVFLLVFLLLFFSSPRFIDTEIMGSMEMDNLSSDKDSLSEENTEKESETQVVEQEEPVSENQVIEQEVRSEKVPEVNQEVNQEVKIAYLTFDDGPTSYLTNILDILAKYEVPATFFMLEPQMNVHANVLCRMNEEGHGLGLHGVTHNRQQFYASQESVLGEMNTAQATLAEITGVKTVLIRTPYGSRPYMKPAYREALGKAGYKIWDWNVDSKDWFYRDKRMVEDTLQQIEALEKKKVTPVILLHERKETVQFLPQILKYLQSKNYVLKVPDAETVPVQFK
ncbi:MAG: polysaccharide deacetylase family protein [Peptococcia bacterium]|jgi:peptidoglycan/xylan/chitin deacetylase (PgdA/CDA1 family)